MYFLEYCSEWPGSAWIREMTDQAVKSGRGILNTFVDSKGRIQISIVLVNGKVPIFFHGSASKEDKDFAIDFFLEHMSFGVSSATVMNAPTKTCVLRRNAYRYQGKPAAVRYWHVDKNEYFTKYANSVIMMELCGADPDYIDNGNRDSDFKQIEI